MTERDTEWNRALAFSFLPHSPDAAHLHPDTAPDVIRATHRALVLAARTQHPGATAAELSDLLDLPASLVARHLGVEAPAAPVPKNGRRTVAHKAKMFHGVNGKSLPA